MPVRGARMRRFPSRRVGKLFLLAAAVFVVWKYWPQKSEAIQTVSADTHIVQEDPLPLSLQLPEADATYVVQEGDTLADVFADADVPYAEIVLLEQASKKVFDLTNIQVGKSVDFAFSDEESSYRLSSVVYQPDANRVIIATQSAAGWIVEEERIEYEIRRATRGGNVEGSLYASALAQGLSDNTIMRFADVFAWDIDFARDTASGDTYKVLYEEKYKDGQFVAPGKILAAEYSNKGKTFQAFFFQPEGKDPGYYTADGSSLQRAFLKAPVNFRYVSSGFSNARFHPILGKVMMHDGVDYAADYGVPIIAIGDGVVSRSGWAGGYGNRIEIRHNERYSSQYSHMSSYVKGLGIGDRVKQGQTIGYVGSTGFSTGNHVHFSMTEYGAYVDPTRVDAPEGEALAEEFMEAFLVNVNEWQDALASITF